MEVQDIIAKLTASSKLLDAKLAIGRTNPFVPIQEIEPIYKRYAELRHILQDNYPSMFDDLPKQPLPKDNGRGDRTRTPRESLVTLKQDIGYCLDILSSVQATSEPAATVTREGVFFAGQFFDALLKITNLITHAKISIVIIDGYIDEDVLNILTAKNAGVVASILTKSKSVLPALVTAGNAFNKQYPSLSIRTSEAFHDRFVIIDDSDFYHFGASIKDLGKRGFMFSRIEESFVIDALRAEFSNEWAKATVVI